ncbi:MAG: Bax inhibitor-1/YccA family protein [Clostridia bacterium]|nr:Bax inhibitor-1/YccA family protein [Clostridia bacterium]
MEEFDNYSKSAVSFNSVIMKTFFWMFLGLASTGIVAFVTFNSDAFTSIISAWPILALIEVVVVIAFHATLRKASASLVTALFFIYSMINGLTLSVIFAAYDLGSIALAFFGTAALFGGLAIIGYKTERDITSLGTILFVGLIAGLIMSIINIFIGSEAFAILIDWVIIAVFCGFTVYDMNKLKLMAESGDFPEEKVAIYCALELYLDFINLFIRILSLIGGRSRD